MSDLERRMERFIVAADMLVEAYGDVSVRGHFGDPGLAAAAFADIKNLISLLEKAGLDKVSFTGADVAALVRMETMFHEHTCECRFCFGFTEGDTSMDLWVRPSKDGGPRTLTHEDGLTEDASRGRRPQYDRPLANGKGNGR